MSTPRCVRRAIEAYRPSKLSTLGTRIRRPEAHGQSIRCQCRRFSSSARVGMAAAPKDITEGFPMPQRSAGPVVEGELTVPRATEDAKEAKETLQEVPVDVPPKKTWSSASSKATESKGARREDQRQQQLQRQPQQHSSPKAARSPTSQDKKGKVGGEETEEGDPAVYAPNVLAAYRKPMRHKPQYGVPVASLQLRSYSVRNLEFFADFAMRAAFYLGLPASGPVPLPKITERWTMPRSNFVHKKSQENFERITMRRLVTVMDGDKSVVEVWLAFLRKWQFYGVGMKANVWEWEQLDVAGKMDKQFHEMEKELDEKLKYFGFNKAVAGRKSLEKMIQKQGARQVGVPMTEVREASQTADQKE